MKKLIIGYLFLSALILGCGSQVVEFAEFSDHDTDAGPPLSLLPDPVPVPNSDLDSGSNLSGDAGSTTSNDAGNNSDTGNPVCVDENCPSGQVCRNGVCTSVDLCTGVTCAEGNVCRNGVCTPVGGVDLCVGVTCPPNSVCNNGVCNSTDPCDGVCCGTGKVCKNGSCVLKDPCDGVQCCFGKVCQNGACVPVDPCAGVQCGEGMVCQNGTCVCGGKDLTPPNPPSYQTSTCNHGKVLVCHFPPGNVSNKHNICVDWHAVPALKKLGDKLGNCSLYL